MSFYCLHCLVEQSRPSVYLVESHIRSHHGVKEPRVGVDFCDESSWQRRQVLREQRADYEGSKFARQLESIRGGDDFIFECGGAP